MADQLAPVYWRALDSNGDFVSLAEAYWYASGTTTPITVYSDEALTTAHPTPQLADASGAFAQVFVASGTDAKVVVKDPSDASTLYTIDPVPLTSTGGTSATNISFAAVTGNSATEAQTAIANNVTRINRLDNGSRLPVSSGSSGAFAVTGAFTATAYAVGQVYEFIANQASVGGGSDTFQVDALAAAGIKKYSGSTTKTDIAAGDIAIGDIVRVKYDGTHFVVASAAIATAAVAGRFKIIDEDTMASDSATAVPTQQSVKAYVDGGRTLLGTIATTSGTSASLGSLVLTNYKHLLLVVLGVSGDASMRITLDSLNMTTTSGSAGASFNGTITVDLTTGVAVGMCAVTASNGEVRSEVTSYDTTTTTITVAPNTGNFDAGSISVWGIK